MKWGPTFFFLLYSCLKSFSATHRNLIKTSYSCHTIFLGCKRADQSNIYPPVESCILCDWFHRTTHLSQNTSYNYFLFYFLTKPFSCLVCLFISSMNHHSIFIFYLFPIQFVSSPFYNLEKLKVFLTKAFINCFCGFFPFCSHSGRFVIVPILHKFHKFGTGQQTRIRGIFYLFKERFFCLICLFTIIGFSLFA